MIRPQSKSLSFVLTAKYEFENKFSIPIEYLTTTCVPVSPQCKNFYVGDEYRSTGRNVSTNLQILAGILSMFISPKFVLLVKSELKKTHTQQQQQQQTNKLICNQNDGIKSNYFQIAP